MSNIYVLCPGNVVTGGPELLHQLVDTLNCNGKNASIVYYPFDYAFYILIIYGGTWLLYEANALLSGEKLLAKISEERATANC